MGDRKLIAPDRLRRIRGLCGKMSFYPTVQLVRQLLDHIELLEERLEQQTVSPEKAD